MVCGQRTVYWAIYLFMYRRLITFLERRYLKHWRCFHDAIQNSLGIRPVCPESSLCAQWVAKDPSFLHADSEDSDQTGRMPRLI